MNKKTGLFFVVSFIFFFLCGCNKNAMTEEHIFKISSENDSDYITDLFQIDRKCGNIICILDDNIVYSRYENESKELVFYKYNINDDLAYYLGKIKGPYISSGDKVAVDNSIFFYHTIFDIASGNADEKSAHSLYQINIEKNTLQKRGSDTAEQTLVYLDELNGKIISLKGKINNNKGVTFLDLFDISNKNSDKFDVFISKEYNEGSGSGDVFYNFSVSGSTIYTISGIYDNFTCSSRMIEKYDCDGNYIGSVKLNKEIVDLMDREHVAKFEVYGNYGFLVTFSGGGALFDISSDEMAPELLSETDLNIAISARNEGAGVVMLYSRETGEIWKLDVVNHKLYKVNLPCERLRCIFVDNDKFLIFTSYDHAIYGDLEKLPIAE